MVITGASTGIGRAIAESWATRGARLVLNARSVERLQDAARACNQRGGDSIVVPGDVTDPPVRQALIEGARAQFGRIDVLVNNAGVGLYGMFEALDPVMLRSVFEVNVVAPMALTQLALPALEESGGTVVMMSSIAGLVAMPRTGGYAASKFALEALTQSLRAELAAQQRKVRVLVVRPGLTETGFAENAHLAEGAPTRTGVKAPIMSAEEVAEATIDAVLQGRAEIDLTIAARAIATLGRVSRPALRAVLARLAPKMGVADRRERG